MANLKDILYTVPLEEVIGSTEMEVRSVAFDSRKVEEGSLFVAVKGTVADGHEYIKGSIEKGAVAIICEIFPEERVGDITYIKVANSAKALGILASNFYQNPSVELILVGITGTNGKTTTATLLYKLFEKLGYKTGLLSTVRNLIHNKEFPATHTTPDPVQLNKLLREMVEKGCTYCFMEVSSHAIDQERISGLSFAGGVFTNITHDHLDYHGTFDKYIKAKKKFFDELDKKAFALTNLDDKRGRVMLQNTKAKKYTYSLSSVGDFNAKILENSFTGLYMSVDGAEIYTRLIGEFNAYNLLAVYATSQLLEADKIEVLKVLSSITSAEGRFEYIVSDEEGIIGIVDYAHTPDALKNVLATIKTIRTGTENLITVVGCGGDRDRAKRPVMAQVAVEYSDRVILTSDNPRSEEPQAIIDEMLKGILPPYDRKTITIVDRKEAIKTACMLAGKQDIILVAGKGHEKYQEIRGEKFPFDDKSILRETLKTMQK